MNRQPSDTFLYRGTSMWPCFQEGDLLEIEPVANDRQLRIGDCVVWSEEQNRKVVHRVVGMQGGLQTRGDALRQNDLSDDKSRQVLGRVVRRHRLGRSSRVAGGLPGRIAGIFYRYAGRIDPERHARGGRLARAARNLVAPLLHPFLKIEYRTGNDDYNRLLVWKLGGKTLAVVDQSTGRSQIPWPWRLVLTVPTE